MNLSSDADAATTDPDSLPLADHRPGLWASVASLFASSGTLVCCALPALLVSLGAGAVMSSLVSAVPQLVFLSEHKEALFIFAGLMLAASSALQWHNRNAPCPVDLALRQACLHTRKFSVRMLGASIGNEEPRPKGRGIKYQRSHTAHCRSPCRRTPRAAGNIPAMIYAVGGWFAFVQPWLGSVDQIF